MKFFSTATNVAQAFKNAGRVREILSVLVSHGFADLLQRMQLSKYLPTRYAEQSKFQAIPAPERLRRSFEQLGPSFVKLGQLFATRSDLLPENYIEEFQKLQDNVSAVPFSEIKELIEAELRAPLGDIFDQFEEVPMAAASIAQVHGAVLKTGERVAVKVQRPQIERLIQNDVSILRGFAVLLERYIPETKVFNPTGLVEEFFRSILFELDFRVEANSIRRIKKNLLDLPKVAVPTVYATYSTGRVLVLERFYGIRFSDREAIVKRGLDPEEIIRVGSDAFFHMVLQDGLFHADLHAGNLFILDDGRIGLIDFGLVGRLSRRVQDSIITIFMALVNEDYETLANEYVSLCQSSKPTDIALLQKDLMDAISPYVGMALGDVNVGQVLLRSTSIATRHHLQVPRELMLLFRAILTIEALGSRLNPTFDMLEVGNRLARQTLNIRYSRERILQDLTVIGRDVEGLVETLPKLLRRFFRQWAQDGFAVRIRNQDVQDLSQAVERFSYSLVLMTLAVGFYVLGTVLFFLNRGPQLGDVSLWGILSFMGGTAVLLRASWQIRKRIK